MQATVNKTILSSKLLIVLLSVLLLHGYGEAKNRSTSVKQVEWQRTEYQNAIDTNALREAQEFYFRKIDVCEKKYRESDEKDVKNKLAREMGSYADTLCVCRILCEYADFDPSKSSPKKIISMACALYNMGSMAESLPLFEILEQAGNVQAINMLGIIYSRMDDWGTALEKFGKGMELMPTGEIYAPIYYNAAMSMLKILGTNYDRIKKKERKGIYDQAQMIANAYQEVIDTQVKESDRVNMHPYSVREYVDGHKYDGINRHELLLGRNLDTELSMLKGWIESDD